LTGEKVRFGAPQVVERDLKVPETRGDQEVQDERDPTVNRVVPGQAGRPLDALGPSPLGHERGYE
jgi:hypothetical protein